MTIQNKNIIKIGDEYGADKLYASVLEVVKHIRGSCPC